MDTPSWSQIIAENVWWVCALIFMATRLPHVRWAAREPVKLSRRPAGEFILLRLGEVAGGVLPVAYIIFDVPSFASYPWFSPFLVLGTLVFAAAIWLSYRSLKDLGKSFSPTLEIRHQHVLVTNGIYRHIRHPIYVAFLLFCLAQTILLPNWVVGLAPWPIAITLFAIRIPREEQMMIDTFGDGYRHYMKTTARFIPGVF